MHGNGACPKTFALIGAAGYIAPRHMRAIKDTGGNLVAAFDPADSVGQMDSFFPDARFFVEFERFDRHVDKLRRRGELIDFISVCSPNYLHDAHARFALRSGADAICEKPLVLNPWNIDALQEIEQATGQKVNTILQLRLHPSIIALKEKVAANGQDRKHEVDLTYITSRGRWYYASWKGDEHKSGGIATNIGVHFYDMLTFVFGPLQENQVHHRAADCASGYLEYEKARVRWFLSINRADLPQNIPADQTTFRSITVDGEELEFSGGFTDLHTQSYEQIIADNGFGLDEVRPSIEAVSHIRTAPVDPSRGEQHPFLSGALHDQRYRNGYPV
ncbi:MAG: oxidoreductase [Methyloceanibacter sp.]|nr:MAG: oxidoreductase [Methyloceanibacter sp.]